MKNTLEILIKTLEKDERLVVDGELLKNKVIELANKMDVELLKLLKSEKELKSHFFTEVDDVLVFDKQKFFDFVNNKNFLADSFTKYKNTIGLSNGDKYFSESNEVVLAWPYKDTVLEGGQSKEDAKRNEIFHNEILAPDQIDRLLDPKVFTNFKKYTKEGEQELKGDEDVDFDNENLIIKGNNLIALHSLKRKFAGKVKLIYIDPPYNTGNDSFNYNDRFNHSTWLTFMKNRLEVARELLSDDGVIFVQCDDNEQAYLKVLMDEIFSERNLINVVCVKMSYVSGVKMSHNDKKLPKIKEYLLGYSKSNKITVHPIYKQANWRDVISRYTQFLLVDNEDPKNLDKWSSTSLSNIFNQNKIDTSDKEDLFVKENAHLIFRTARNNSKQIKELPNDNSFREIITSTGLKKIIHKGEEVVFASSKLVDGSFVEPLGDIWEDIAINNLHNEGQVDFKLGKKPEKLIYRIIEFITDEGDLVMDFHLGSGTTAAVAHKMGRRYIGIEQMDYINDITVPRLQKVIGKPKKEVGKLIEELEYDNGGISQDVDWQGGGSFVYCEIAEWNEDFAQKVQKAKNEKELEMIWQEMQNKSFLSHKVDIKKIDETKSEYEELEFEDKKKFLIEALDKNYLYIPYSEIDDEEFEVTEQDKKLNGMFYKS